FAGAVDPQGATAHFSTVHPEAGRTRLLDVVLYARPVVAHDATGNRADTRADRRRTAAVSDKRTQAGPERSACTRPYSSPTTLPHFPCAGAADREAQCADAAQQLRCTRHVLHDCSPVCQQTLLCQRRC